MKYANLQSLLKEEDWWIYVERLTSYAERLMSTRYWRSEEGGPSTGGKDAVDFAEQAIIDVVDGTRAWDPNTQPDLLTHLCGIVKSNISNFSKRHENLKSERYDSDIHDEQVSSRVVIASQSIEDEEFANDFIGFIIDDENLVSYVEAVLFHDCTERNDIALRLKVPPSDITNMKKKLHRRLESFIKQRNSRANSELV